MSTPTVSLVVVAHSRALAQGVAELAAQMAPDVLVIPAGGTDDGRLGTSFDLITHAIDDALRDGRQAVVLTDLGSAVLTTETVLELAEPDVAARVHLVDAPLVEGAVEAAVAAQSGARIDDVVGAARRAGSTFSAHGRPSPESGPGVPAGPSSAPSAAGPDAAEVGSRRGPGAEGDSTVGGGPVDVAAHDGSGPAEGGTATRGTGPAPQASATARGTAVLRNRLGLHARPAAQLARTASGFQSTIAVDGADARSILSLVALGAVGGQRLAVTAAGPDAAQAVRAVVAELEQGFGEA